MRGEIFTDCVFYPAAHAKGAPVPAGRLRRPKVLRRVLRLRKTGVRASGASTK